jgi:serine/threonine-protein kinase
VVDGRLEQRLTDIGLAATAQLAPGATIRPDVTALAATAAAPAPEHVPAERSPALPRISVDLRRSFDRPGRGDAQSHADLELTGLIGEGGMGRVFLARQHSLDRDVAVKTVKDEAPAEAHEALLLEGRIAGRLEHPAIVPVHVLGVDEAGRPAMVMKRIEGVSYDALLDDPSHSGWESWEGDADDRLPGHLQILTQICNALHYAHSHGIVHRDLKPENVLIGQFGDVYLADWGIATHIGEGQDRRLCGTPGYMAPEMVFGKAVDARTDVYLLGATLHEILTGRPRHDVATFADALAAAGVSAPHDYDDGLPKPLTDLANRACAPDPDERPESARAFREALASFLHRRDSVALATEAAERFAQLKALVELPSPNEDERRQIEQLSAAARFGFEQAISRWNDNEAAQQGLSELDTLLDRRRARAAELERLARERDPSVAADVRAVAILGLLVLSSIVVGIAAATASTQGDLGAWQLVLYPSGVLFVILVGTAFLRKRLLENAFNRQATLLIITLMVTVIVSRMLNAIAPIHVANVFARDSLACAAVLAVGAFTLLRWLGWLALVMVATALGCVLVPERALLVFGGGTTLSVFFATGFAWRSRNDVERPEP